MTAETLVDRLNRETAGFTPEDVIRHACREFREGLTQASSLGEEDQVLLDMISKIQPDIAVFTLDTGRLFQETYDLMEKNRKRYAVPFQIYYPDSEAVEDMVAAHGINLFYESVANRKLCCRIRKIEPLRRALKGKTAWITGLRRGQSATRSSAEFFEWDDANQMVKVSPLTYWSLDQVKDYISRHQVEVNPLHARGFISIGCASCTRAVAPGEDIRAGRWWWEQPEQKECGLHNNLKKPYSGATQEAPDGQ